MHLILAAFSFAAVGGWLLTALKVVIGLGLVIFVHELGHFSVAKLCGVKCEKFYLGFDVAGKKLWSRKWGETEYGIGVVPLGGYVKMLGQDDNPAKAAEERRRSTQHSAAVTHSGDLPHEPTAEEAAAYDPRSYMAKSVPQRMAIISAGVISNLIFAVIFAAIAYRNGVPYTPTIIGAVTPGDPAWQAGLKPGDKIIQFGDNPPSEDLRFEQDLRSSVIFAGGGHELPMTVRPYHSDRLRKVVLRPTNSHKAETEIPVIGVVPTATTVIGEIDPNSPAADAQPKFEKEDKVVAIQTGGKTTKTDDFVELQAALAAHRDETIVFVVDRKIDADKPDSATKPLEIKVAANPRPYLGIVMNAGPITAVQADSPAEKAGFKVGDVIVSVAGQPAGDPLRLPELVRLHAGQPIAVEVRRTNAAGAETTVTLTVTPNEPRSMDPPGGPNYPWSCDELGIAYSVQNSVQSIDAGASEAAKAIQPGDVIVSAEFVPANDEEKADFKKRHLPTKPIVFDSDHLNWPYLQLNLDGAPKGAHVELKFRRGKEEKSASLPVLIAPNWFLVLRGTMFVGLTETRTADNWGEAFRLGLRETKESVEQVVTVLRKLFSGDLPLSIFGGPFTIAAVAANSASQGMTKLLIFLTLLSGNLAVINFLPIPVLDGGHMMFLLYEGIRGKPASEKVMTTLTYVGLILILTLMIFVLGLDVPRFIHWVGSWFS